MTTQVEVEQQESKSTVKERLSTGRKFYFTAWIVEIIAAAIGLTIAWSQGYASYLYLLSENEGVFPMAQLFDLFIAALPFIMVAIAELLKIPFAYLVYMNRRLVVKVVYSFVLLTVTIITFETLIFGFERQYTNITQQVRVPQKQLDIVDIKLADIDKRTARLENQTEDSIKLTINEMLQSAKQNKDFDIENYNNQKNALYKSTNSSAYSQIEILQQENNQIESQAETSISQLQKTLKISIKEESSNAKQRTIDQNKQIDALRDEILRIEEKIASKEVSLGALGALFSTDIPKWEKDIVRKEKQIDSLISSGSMISTTSGKIDGRIESIRSKANNKISENNNKISQLKIKVALAQGDNFKIKSIDENIQIRLEAYTDSLSIIEKKRSKMEKDFENRDAVIEGLYADKNKLTESQGAIKSQIDKAASNSQVYRIAMSWYEKNRASDVTRIEADNVAFFWFGSLALIVSTIGVSLAFGAYILKHPVKGYSAKTRTKGRIIKSLMLTLRRLRKRLRNPKVVTKIKEVEVVKEVVKEVPVDKVVFKEVK